MYRQFCDKIDMVVDRQRMVVSVTLRDIAFHSVADTGGKQASAATGCKATEPPQ